MVFLYGSGSFIISFFGLLFDDLTGTDTYFMWSLSKTTIKTTFLFCYLLLLFFP